MNLLPFLAIIAAFKASSPAWAASPMASLCGDPSDCSIKQDIPVVTQAKILPDINIAKPKARARVSAIKKESRTDAGLANLPGEYLALDRKSYKGASSVFILPDKQFGVPLGGLKSGDMCMAELDQAITASQNVRSPIRVTLLDGPYKGATLLGEAYQDKDLKERILLEFTKIRLRNKDTTYKLKASGHALTGEAGLLGDYHSNETMLFAGEFLSAAVAGYADATVQRSQNNIGTFQNNPTVDNAAKLGLVNAAARSADRFAEKARTAGGYTTITGIQKILILILEDPVEG